LIPTGMLSEPETAVQEVPVDQLSPNRYQPRTKADEEAMLELAKSIKTHGIIQPLIVRKRGNHLELIAGERRLEAAKRAGLLRVPVVMREASDREMLELALVENLQREDINALDAAEAYSRLMTEFHLTQEQVAERVGKSRPAVANSLRLLNLPSIMQDAIRQGRLEEGHGKVLAGVEDDRTRYRLFRSMLRRNLSVRDAAILAEKLISERPTGPQAGTRAAIDPNVKEIEDRLRRAVDAQVKIKPKGKGGTIEVSYADWNDLDRIYWRLIRLEGVTPQHDPAWDIPAKRDE